MKSTTMALAALTLLSGTALTGTARAGTYSFDFDGPGVYGALTLTYGPGTDATYSEALAVTGVSGTFSDTNKGLDLINEPVNAVVGLNISAPEPTNKRAPADFSHFNVASGLEHGFISYDNLYWPDGSPQTATDYPIFGGFLDIYGLLFTLADGKVVNFWSNGDLTGSGVSDYGVAVVTHDVALDLVEGGVSVPEPASLALLGAGLLGLLVRRQRPAA